MRIASTSKPRRVLRHLAAIGSVAALILMVPAAQALGSSQAGLAGNPAVVAPALATDTPTVLPTDTPLPPPTDTPLPPPTDTPTPLPTLPPTPPPTLPPTPPPTPRPTLPPTPPPTPTDTPTATPTDTPTPLPTLPPTPPPTDAPTPFIPTPPPPTFPGATPKPAGPKDLTTTISIELPSASVLGAPVTVVAVLKDSKGAAVAGKHLSLFLDTQSLTGAQTDASGRASFVIPAKNLTLASSYAVGILFSGAHGLGGSVAAANMSVLDAAIQIRTVPPLPQVSFALGAVTATTGPDGVAALPIPQSGPYQLSADLNADNSASATVKASFLRWVDNVTTPERTINVAGPATYTVVLRLAYRAKIDYVDQNGQPVDPTLIEEARFSPTSGGGDVVVNSQAGAATVWWTAAETAQVGQVATATPVIYRAMSVKVHGAETITPGEQTWAPTEDGVWTIKLSLFSVSVGARDALLGSRISGQVRLTYPDGSHIDRPIGPNGIATFNALPGATYKVEIDSVAVPVSMQLAVPRFGSATLTAVTFGDVGIGAGLALVIMSLLALVLRSRLIKRRISRLGPADAVPEAG